MQDKTLTETPRITFLGPVGATFSHHAYDLLAEAYGGPPAISEGPTTNCVPADKNSNIIPMICKHGGYGAIAVETLAGGRVDEPLKSFIELLQVYDHTSCPITITGAIRNRIHFYLMGKPGMHHADIREVTAHPQALFACRRKLALLGVKTYEAMSNGDAAHVVSEAAKFEPKRGIAAIGPESAAKKYGLDILGAAFEDAVAVTTFFLIAPKGKSPSVGKENRALVVFRTLNQHGALVSALHAFSDEGFNLIQIHSVYAGNGDHSGYDFAVEVEVGQEQLRHFNRAMQTLEQKAQKHLTFGPFEIQSR